MNLSKHLSLKEVIKSNTAQRLGIDNTPDDEALSNLRLVALHIFEPIRQHFNVPIGISSGYRSPKLSQAIGSSSKSQHCKGQALDIDADIYGKLTNSDIYKFVLDSLNFDQMIIEYPDDKGRPAWVHISYKGEKNNRNQTLIAIKENGKTKYLPYEDNKHLLI